MKTFKKVAIVGVGFMGGSLVLALKEKFPHLTCVGFARSRRSYNRLRRLKIVDRVTMNLKEVIENADLVVLALPVYTIVEYLKKISPFLKKGAILFDLGSSKTLIEREAAKTLPKNVSFVGCHPLCGSEKSGAYFSKPDLFKGSLCIITSPLSKGATQVVKKLWEKLGAKVIFLSPHRHDQALSSTSHLSHLISFSLTDLVSANYLKLSLPSLKGLTRIADSPPMVWTDIFLSNAKNITKDVDRFIKILRVFKKLIRKKDKEGISKLIKKINAKQKVLSRQKDNRKR